MFADRCLIVSGGVDVISGRGGEGSGVCCEGDWTFLIDASPKDNAFVDSGLARGILDGPGCKFSELKGRLPTNASREADKSGTEG